MVIFLEQAELRAKQRQDLTLDYWHRNVDRLLEFNERPVLDHLGSLTADEARTLAEARYETFDAHRRQQEALAADAEDLMELEQIEADAEAGVIMDIWDIDAWTKHSDSIDTKC